MKKYFLLFGLLSLVHITIHAQCGVNYQQTLDKYCKGIYLLHSEIVNQSKENTISMVLKADNNYTLYFLNPGNSISDISLKGFFNGLDLNIEMHYYSTDNYAICNIMPKESGIYIFSVNFNSSQKSCVLMAIYYQNEANIKAGFYKSFDEMRFNNPSEELIYKIEEKQEKASKKQVVNYYYVKTGTKKEQKTISKYYGFCDGSDKYISLETRNFSGAAAFVKMEDISIYYYFEEIEYIPLVAGSVITVTPVFRQKLLNKNTGEILLLTKKFLNELISGDQELLEKFENEKHKTAVLKDYLLLYIAKHYKNE